MSAVAEATEPAPAQSDRLLDEHERLLAHRMIRLLDLGFSVEQATPLVHVTDVAHTAEDMLAKGWSHAFVVEELT